MISFNKIISAENTERNTELQQYDSLPRGSALITSSGDLDNKGITTIIHAATGSMSKSGSFYDPTRESVTNSIMNGFILMESNRLSGIAVPFLGGRIFKSRIGLNDHELAFLITDSCFKNCGNIPFVIIAYGDVDYNTFLQVFKENFEKIDSDTYLKQGDILDYELHQCEVIMNASNMEVVFGGGLAGKIGTATNSRNQIDLEAKLAIKEFWTSSELVNDI